MKKGYLTGAVKTENDIIKNIIAADNNKPAQEKETDSKLTIRISKENHRKIKMYCIKHGLTVKKLIDDYINGLTV